MGDNRPLGAIAREHGYTRADLAALTGFNRSTIGRLWNDPCWIDRPGLELRTVLTLGDFLPGVNELLGRKARVSDRLSAELTSHGIEIRHDMIDRTALAVEHVNAALLAGSRLLRRDAAKAADTLTRFWGRDQNRALGAVLDPGPDGLLVDSNPLLDAAADVADDLHELPGWSATIASAVLQHHSSRITGQGPTTELPAKRRTAHTLAFVRRSQTVGLVLCGDEDALARYQQSVATDPVAAMVEVASYASYYGDHQADRDFWLPASVRLDNTSAEILKEIPTHPDLYIALLAGVYLPIALERDPSFAGRRHELHRALVARRATTDNQTTVECLTTLIHRLESVSP